MTHSRWKSAGIRRTVTCSILFAATAGVSASADEAAPKLRYEWKAGDIFAYEVFVTADRPDAVDQLMGVITYTVKSVGEQQVDVSFAGNVGRKETPKPTQNSGGPRRPGRPRPGGGPGGPRGPLFGAGSMTGLTWQTNDVRLTNTGEFVSLKGTSQLPYLLGNRNGGIRRNAAEAWAKWSKLLIENGAETKPTGNDTRKARPR